MAYLVWNILYIFYFNRNDIKYVSDTHVDYSKVVNEDCGTFHEIPISTTELNIRTVNAPVQSAPLLKIALGNSHSS